jgi:hypothetical protein
LVGRLQTYVPAPTNGNANVGEMESEDSGDEEDDGDDSSGMMFSTAPSDL